MNTLYFITSNKGKVKELQNKLSDLQIEVLQHDLGYPEPQVSSLEEVAQFGVKYLQQLGIDRPFILEDAGLFIDELKGFPGVYSKYVFTTIGNQGILDLLKDSQDRTATFQSVIAYATPQGEPHLFKGECNGTLATSMRGSNGFGYDPLFIPKNNTQTFAEMTTQQKNTYSHRGKATNNLKQFLQRKKSSHLS